MKLFIERVCQWYCDHFGTEAAFAISVCGLLVWVALIPLLGWTHWNSTVGLFGNTVESTGEWFFAVATLVTARAITTHQRREQERTDALLASIEAQSKRIEALGEEIFDAINRLER